MLRGMVKPLVIVALTFIIIVIGDDETRLFLKKAVKRITGKTI